MTLYDLISNIHTGTVVSTIVLLAGLVEISPIKINPIQSLGKLLNRETNKELTELKQQLEIMGEKHVENAEYLNSKIDGIEGDLQNHIAESMRRDILDFQNSCLLNRKHTKEEFTYIYRLCDKYERYIEDNELDNSEAEEAIHYIRLVYRDCLESGEFLIKQ